MLQERVDHRICCNAVGFSFKRADHAMAKHRFRYPLYILERNIRAPFTKRDGF